MPTMENEVSPSVYAAFRHNPALQKWQDEEAPLLFPTIYNGSVEKVPIEYLRYWFDRAMER